MPQQSPNNQASPHAARMNHVAERVREINRPKLIGESPSDDAQRTAYIFTQTIRSDAERDGIPWRLLKHFLVTIHGSPDIPKPKGMAQIIDTAKSSSGHPRQRTNPKRLHCSRMKVARSCSQNRQLSLMDLTFDLFPSNTVHNHAINRRARRSRF